GDDIARPCFLDTRALKSTESKELGHAPAFDRIAVTIEDLHYLVWADGAGCNASGDNAPEIRVGFENCPQHTKRPIFDLRGFHVSEHEIEERRHRLFPPFQGRRHPPFLPR